MKKLIILLFFLFADSAFSQTRKLSIHRLIPNKDVDSLMTMVGSSTHEKHICYSLTAMDALNEYLFMALRFDIGKANSYFQPTQPEFVHLVGYFIYDGNVVFAYSNNEQFGKYYKRTAEKRKFNIKLYKDTIDGFNTAALNSHDPEGKNSPFFFLIGHPGK